MIKKTMILGSVLILLAPGAFTVGRQGTPERPWDIHGRLILSEDGHRIVHEDGTPFLWIGGTVWGMTEWLDREGVNIYLDDRKEKGVNVVQACLIWGKRRDPGGFTANDRNAYGHRYVNATHRGATGSRDPWIGPEPCTGASGHVRGRSRHPSVQVKDKPKTER